MLTECTYIPSLFLMVVAGRIKWMRSAILASQAVQIGWQSCMGATTGWGGGARLVGLLGRGKALKLLAHGTPLCGADAME